jgi:gp58
MTRKELLEAAIKTVTEDRQDQYGSPEQSLEAIACFWTTYICAANPGADIIVSGRDVAAMMSLLKIARTATGAAKLDNWVDIAGYAACGAELDGIVE